MKMEGEYSLGGRPVTKEEYECVVNRGKWTGERCMTEAECQCLDNCGKWENGICVPPIMAVDLTGIVPGLTSGQFAAGWGTLPEGTATVNIVYMAAGGRAHRVYEGIKADFPPPVIVSGQRKGVTVVWHVEAFNEWGHKTGYSNEVTTITK